MAQFYGSVQGNRGEATRLGGKTSGLRTRAQTWTLYLQADLWHSEGRKADMGAFTLKTRSGITVELGDFDVDAVARALESKDGPNALTVENALTFIRKGFALLESADVYAKDGGNNA